MGTAGDFYTDEALKSQEYFVYFKISKCTTGEKDPLIHGKPNLRAEAKFT